MKVLKRTWADISLDNLEHNYKTLREHVGKGPRFLGVVKADAYGHGAVQVSRTLEELGAEYLAVSNLEEAVQLRPTKPSFPSRRRCTACNTQRTSTKRSRERGKS